MMKKLLIIGHTFPEPTTTAAGKRMMDIIDLFIENNFHITFVSTAKKTERSEKLDIKNISIKNIHLNDSSFDGFISDLAPQVVVFDRYITEEQFGWRVAEHSPNSLRILDTEDLHFLRKAREEATRANKAVSEANLFSDVAKREIASIMRCDLSLIISEVEMELLQTKFKIPGDILYYLPFLIEGKPRPLLPFSTRKDFVAIGNLLHAPNVDAVLQLKKIWPKIRKQLPKTVLQVYGAYAPQQITQLHNEREGFLIKGWTADLESTLNQYRLQLAYIRFGAGLKGKLMDAMCCGLPSITTNIGAEGINGNLPFGGRIASTPEEFVQAAVELYTHETKWINAQRNGFGIMQQRFQKENHAIPFRERIDAVQKNLKEHRQENFLGQVMQHQSLQATKYMSKWIEAKNKSFQNSSPVCFANSEEVRPEYR